MIALLWSIALALAMPPPEATPRRLTPPLAVDSPAITTHLALRQGGGLLRVPQYKMPGWPGRVNLVLAGVMEGMEFQGALSKRTALYGRLGGQAIAGLNADSAFLQGAQTSGFLEIGVRHAVWVDRKGMVTLRTFGNGSRGAGLTPEPLASALATDRWGTVSAILDGNALDYVLGRRTGLTAGLGVSGLRTLTEELGVQGSLTVRAGRVTYTGAEAKQRTSRTAASAGVAFGWRPQAVPLGVQLEIHDRQEQEGWLAGDLSASAENRALLAATLAYTGRRELHLGVTGAVLAPSGHPGSEQLYTLDLALRYDFGISAP